MAKDLGFLTCQLRSQLFIARLDEVEFCVMALEFGLVMERHEGPWQPVMDFLEKTLRLSPPPTPPWKEDIPWYKRQASRLEVVAPTILRFDALAGDLPGEQRRRTFAAFRAVNGASGLEGTWPEALSLEFVSLCSRTISSWTSGFE